MKYSELGFDSMPPVNMVPRYATPPQHTTSTANLITYSFLPYRCFFLRRTLIHGSYTSIPLIKYTNKPF